MMKQFACIFFVFGLLVMQSSCKKDGFITSNNALLRTSADTLHFDTVFTTVGSITQSFKIFNPNDKKLRLSNVQLMGGSSSFFKINVDGISGTTFNNIEINANDSVYVFAMVTINPNSSNLPFVVQDSIKIEYNGNTRFVQLDAFGQNANFLRDKRVTSDTTWNNNLPFVILGSLIVDQGKTLTIQKGTKVYFNASAPMIVRGTLKAIGERFDSTRIQFAGDRLDNFYRDFPGSWPGIYFTETSVNNQLQYCIIKNAYQGTIAQNPATNSNPKLQLQECILDNIYDVAVGGSNTSITATNCLISNCGYNIFLTAGGNYNINHCTVASYGNNYLQHKNAVLTISNVASATTTNVVNANISNSIFYGEGGLVEDEIVLNKQGTTAFNITFNNVLYKMKSNDPASASFTGNKLKNVAPNFDSINTSLRYFNFRLKPSSEAVNKGTNTGVLIDLDGKNRAFGLPDLGSFELQ